MLFLEDLSYHYYQVGFAIIITTNYLKRHLIFFVGLGVGVSFKHFSVQENAQERVFLKALGLVQHKTPVNEKSVEKAEYLQESENPEYFI